MTVPGRWLRMVERAPDLEAVVHLTAGEESVRWTWQRLWAYAESFADHLYATGVRKGDVCAFIFRHDPEFYPRYLAAALLGAIPSVLAYPNARVHPDKYRQGLSGIAARSGLDWILTTPDLHEMIDPVIRKSGRSIKGVLFCSNVAERSSAPGRRRTESSPDEPCLLQHSSGTTGLQKAVVLSHRAVLEHVLRYGEAIQASAADKVISWLPLYHDMGLIAAFHLPLALGITTIQMDPFEWVVAPMLLAEAISAEKATLCWLPNFAYNLMASRVRDEELDGIDLRSMRLFINCSEPVRAESHNEFLTRFGRAGIDAAKLGASYAMAETTFAVTQTPPGQVTATISADRAALARGRVEASREPGSARLCVTSGRVISGCGLRVLDEYGEDLAENTVGELVVTSVSLSDGYRNWPEKTSESFRDGWYFTGDLGFLRDGDVFVVGRKKDVMIVAGKNIYPEDVEDAVGRVAGVIPGRVVAFGADDVALGTDKICVIVESEEHNRDHDGLVARIRKSGAEIDVTITDVFVVPPRWLIKSTAGKPSRSANRSRILTVVDEKVSP